MALNNFVDSLSASMRIGLAALGSMYFDASFAELAAGDEVLPLHRGEFVPDVHWVAWYVHALGLLSRWCPNGTSGCENSFWLREVDSLAALTGKFVLKLAGVGAGDARRLHVIAWNEFVVGLKLLFGDKGDVLLVGYVAPGEWELAMEAATLIAAEFKVQAFYANSAWGDDGPARIWNSEDLQRDAPMRVFFR